MNLSKAVKTVRMKPDGTNYTASAASSDATSDILDTAGFDSVRFLVGFGAIVTNGVQGIKVQQNTANSATGMADLAGSAITVADSDDGKVAISDIYRPQERYLRVITTRATQNSTVDFLIAELYNAKSQPITDDATVISSELSLSPAEGTA